MFTKFKEAIMAQAQVMQQHQLFRTDICKDKMWETYLSSFKEGTNPLYKERTEHDCQVCKQFIRSVGNIVAAIDGEIVSIWDVEDVGIYQPVADALSILVKSKQISGIFLSVEQKIGVDKNRQLLKSGKVKVWNHFYLALPSSVVVSNLYIGTKLSRARGNMEVFHRGLKELTLDAAETILELIEQGSLYRGEEHKSAVEAFICYKKKWNTLTSDVHKDIFVWQQGVYPIRNTVIGSLLIDLSEGKDLDGSVASYEAKVAPMNYKRPKSLITRGMIDKAEKKVDELGFLSALARRYAVTDDITINNVLFADRAAKKQMGVFDSLAASIPESIPSLDKIEEVSIETFVSEILPKAETIEVVPENSHLGNFVSLIAPIDKDASNMLKWKNNFSWSYAGEATDSIKERVKSAGGSVTGDFRASLSWYNRDDLDLHLVEPAGENICYRNKYSNRTGAILDVDMNAGIGTTRTPVENITYPKRDKMMEGIYHIYVHQYSQRETVDYGFEVEIEFGGVAYNYAYTKPVTDCITVVKFRLNDNGIEFLESLPSATTSKEVWGVDTHVFQKVSMIMYSPNHWDGEQTGNKHYFFMLEECKQEGHARGFYNEFLTDDLREHRKVFEVLGSRMKTPESEDQLSGLGFSSTQRNSILCRVTGSFTRTIKVKV